MEREITVLRASFAPVSKRSRRSLQDLVAFLGELQGAGVDLYLDRQGIDTSTPAGKALFQMLVVRI